VVVGLDQNTAAEDVRNHAVDQILDIVRTVVILIATCAVAEGLVMTNVVVETVGRKL